MYFCLCLEFNFVVTQEKSMSGQKTELQADKLDSKAISFLTVAL